MKEKRTEYLPKGIGQENKKINQTNQLQLYGVGIMEDKMKIVVVSQSLAFIRRYLVFHYYYYFVFVCLFLFYYY